MIIGMDCMCSLGIYISTEETRTNGMIIVNIWRIIMNIWRSKKAAMNKSFMEPKSINQAMVNWNQISSFQKNNHKIRNWSNTNLLFAWFGLIWLIVIVESAKHLGRSYPIEVYIRVQHTHTVNLEAVTSLHYLSPPGDSRWRVLTSLRILLD
jgi:hypothetical protein